MKSGAGGRGRPGQVVATAGRRVIVRDADGERACFLAGQRAVVGDRVLFVDAPGEGGKIVSVEPRGAVLARADAKGRDQILAANLQGIAIVTTPSDPPFRAGLVDRYLVAAGAGDLEAVVVLNKMDLGIPADVEAELALRRGAGIPILVVSARTDAGVAPLRELLATATGPWALVGHSGVGKTSLVAALLPGEDVGDIGHISAYWGRGRHTTSGSRLFTVPTGGQIVDSPGIRTFAPGRLTAADVRGSFPGMADLRCRFRDCLHREGEQGCVAPSEVDPALLASYRRLLAEIQDIDDARRPSP
jgi:ribosome biogenesis GTPase